MSDNFPPAPGGYAAGSRIAGYLLEEQIGQGGMAVVFRALDERLDRLVALKILAPALAADEAFRQRFIRESRAAAAVDDPHIIPVFEAGEASGVLFIAMRYVRGGDVRSLVNRMGPLPPGRVAEIVSQVSSALDAAHGRGLVHRDVKPANMLLDASGGAGRPDHVYLSDFGLSKGSLQSSGLTGTGTFLGTLDYIAPEQIEGKPVDGRADQYALACAAYELLTGVPPFQREEAMAVMYAQLSEPPPRLTSRRPDLQPAADDVFARALAKAPADRYRACREFSDALREAFGIRPYDSGPGATPGPERPVTQLAWPSGPTPATPATSVAPADPGAAWGSGGQQGTSGTGEPVSVGGPATQLASDRPGSTTPGLTTQGSGPADWNQGATGVGGSGGRSRPGWRSPAALVGAFVVLVGLGGGGAYFALKGPAKTVHGHHAITLALPGCSQATAKSGNLPLPTKSATISDNPFGLQVTQQGKFVFGVTPTTLQVLGAGHGLTLTPKFSYTIATPDMPAKGAITTNGGKYLLVAAGNGIDVLSTEDAKIGAQSVNVGTLTVPTATGNEGAVEVAVSPDNHFAFVTLQFANEVAVFNLQAALTNGFGANAFVGTVPVSPQPVGMAVSPDGQSLYVTSFGWKQHQTPGPGVVTVLSVSKLEQSPGSAKLAQVNAGCSPARVITSADGKTVWVTARESNYLLGFAAAKMVSDSGHSLIAKVQVGQSPIGEILVNNGARIVVADTDLGDIGQTGHNLAVVNTALALAGKSALLGYVQTGKQPREFAQFGQYLYVSDNGSAQIQAIDLSKLP